MFEIKAMSRLKIGRMHNRKLRRSGFIPGVVYGGNGTARSISINHNEIIKSLQHESIYSSVISLTIDGLKEDVILKALDRHPYRPQILHIDLQRVQQDRSISVNVPLHFVNAETSPGVKAQGGQAVHYFNELKVSCLPKNLPGSIEVNMAHLNLNDQIHTYDLTLPDGVTLDTTARRSDVIAAIQPPSENLPESDEGENLSTPENEG